MKPGGQRAKGKAFECKVAAMIRERWPGALVRRASQAERAHNPDVFIEGGPLILRWLWLELQDSTHPTPHAKLEQARNDVAADPRMYEIGESRIPAAVTHKLGAREILVTMNIGDAMNIVDVNGRHFESAGEVSIEFEQWLWFVARKGQSEDGSRSEDGTRLVHGPTYAPGTFRASDLNAVQDRIIDSARACE